MADWTFGDDAVRVTVKHEGERLTAAVHDLKSGRRWGPVPLLALEIHDKRLRRIERPDALRVDHVEEVDGGVHVTVGHGQLNVSVGVWLRVRGGELSVMLQPAEVYERVPELFRVFAVDVLPGLMAVGAGGTLVLPLGSGIVCDPGTKPKLVDRFMLYGEQARWEIMPTLPVCAAHDAAGGLAQLAVQGAPETECRVATDGEGCGRAGFGFCLRQHWHDPVEMGIRELRYVPIAPDADPVVSTAKRLRRHVMDDLGKKTLAERAAESPEVDYLLKAYIMKLFYAVENEGDMMVGRDRSDPASFVRVMDFAEAADGLQRLRAAGLEHVYTQSVGWNARGHDGLYPTRFPVEERLGGEAGFRRLLAGGAALGYRMSVHDNFNMAVASSPDFDPDLVTQDMFGESLVHGWWGGGLECQTWPLALPEERLGGHLRRMRELGVRGTYYCDYMGQPLEVNYHPRHGGSRTAHARGQALVLETARDVFGSAGTECGFLFVALPADHMAGCGDVARLKERQPDWPVGWLVDRSVPLWELALHGLIVKEARGEPGWDAVAQVLLKGDHPRDEWSAHPGVMPVLDDARIAKLKAMYDVCLVEFGRLQRLELTHSAEPEPGVRTSRYEDGTEVIVDSRAREMLVDGEPVKLPEVLK